MARIGIFGKGFVGEALYEGFRAHGGHEFFVYDPVRARRTHTPEEVAENAEFLFLCVPTPSDSDGIDLSILDRTFSTIAPYVTGDKIVLIKSTVIPGTTRRYISQYPAMNIGFSPEFLTEANSMEDFKNASRHIVGTDDPEIADRVERLFTAQFPERPFLKMRPEEAELVKYGANTFMAVKVTLANILYDLAYQFGVSFDPVHDGVLADARIGNSHFDVTSERGYGGKCFPKDLYALLKQLRALGLDRQADVLQAVHDYNMAIRRDHDWESIDGALRL